MGLSTADSSSLGTMSTITSAISNAGTAFENKLEELSESTADSSLGTMTTAAIEAQMHQAVFEIASGAGKSLTDAMKGVSRKLG